MKHEFEKYCKEPEKIENYYKAKKDNFKGWECHHRLETHTSDGERLSVDISHEELKALGMYYNRPPEELIFLTTSEHHVFRKGKHHTEEAKNKMSEAHKDKQFTESHKKKIGAANKGNKNRLGKKHSEESKKRMAEAAKGKNIWTKGTRWYNNGRINKRAKKCPPGFVPGRIKKP